MEDLNSIPSATSTSDTAMDSTSDVEIEDPIGLETVKIYVGPKRKEYVVHKKPLCSASAYFDKAFNIGFKEGEENEMYLPEDHAGAFSLFLNWIYRGTFPDGHSHYHVESLYQVYVFQHKISFETPLLADTVMDKLQDVSKAHDLYIDLSTVGMIYSGTTGECALRRFCVQLLQYRIFDGTSSITTSSVYRESVGDLAHELHDLCSKSLDFFQDYSAWLAINQGRGGDPRERDEEDPEDRCYYHCHAKGDGACPLDNKEPAPSEKTEIGIHESEDD